MIAKVSDGECLGKVLGKMQLMNRQRYGRSKELQSKHI